MADILDKLTYGDPTLTLSDLGERMATSEFERARKQQERDAEKARRAEVARVKEQDRLQRQQYLEGRKAEAARAEASLEARAAELRSFLVDGLPSTVSVGLHQLRRTPVVPALRLANLIVETPTPDWDRFAPPPPGFWKRSFAQAAAAEELQRAQVLQRRI